MKIPSAEQIRQADLYTIEHEPVSSIELMERAAMACVKWILSRFGSEPGFAVFCGTGNNGGDGLAIARLLKANNCRVHAYIIHYSDQGSADFRENRERLNSALRTDIHKEAELSDIDIAAPGLILIDALFGSGLNRPVEGIAAAAIGRMNASGKKIISIDIPSGLYCDELNSPADIRVHAHHTLSFQFPKRSFMFPENAESVGEFSVLDIQLHPAFIQQLNADDHFISPDDIVLFPKRRSHAAHKGNFGHAFLIAGSHGKMGASVLASRACMRTGVGLLTAHVPGCGYAIMQTAIPEAMVMADRNANCISEVNIPDRSNALGIGPGIGTSTETRYAFRKIITTCKIPMVLDADALNILSENKELLARLAEGTILTPHPGEFERLAGPSENSADRLALQRAFSQKYNIHVVLKGAHTSISCPDGRIFFNSTGNPGMATAGSGDVLTGMICSLLAQHYSPLPAAITGVFLHGLAGDLAAGEKGQEGMIASDIIDFIPAAFQFLHSMDEL